MNAIDSLYEILNLYITGYKGLAYEAFDGLGVDYHNQILKVLGSLEGGQEVIDFLAA